MIIRTGDIIMANLPTVGRNIQSGIRPCVVVGNNLSNKYSPLIYVVPITSKLKNLNQPTHVILSKDLGLKEDSMALCEQAMSINRENIISKIGQLDDNYLEDVQLGVTIHMLFGKNMSKRLNSFVNKVHERNYELVGA